MEPNHGFTIFRCASFLLFKIVILWRNLWNQIMALNHCKILIFFSLYNSFKNILLDILTNNIYGTKSWFPTIFIYASFIFFKIVILWRNILLYMFTYSKHGIKSSSHFYKIANLSTNILIDMFTSISIGYQNKVPSQLLCLF